MRKSFDNEEKLFQIRRLCCGQRGVLGPEHRHGSLGLKARSPLVRCGQLAAQLGSQYRYRALVQQQVTELSH